MSRLTFRFTDYLIFAAAVTITIFCAAQIYGKNDSALQVVVQGKNGSWVYPINQNIQVEIPGPLGQTIVELKDGKARVVFSPCTNQTCVTSGHIHKSGQWAACLPNAVFVRVEATGAKQVQNGQGAKVDGAVW